MKIKALARKGASNDIGIRKGDFDFVEGKEAYAAILEAAVLTVKGELIYDVNKGVPYFDTAFLSPLYIDMWAEKVKERILAFSFVKGIESFEYEFDGDAGRVDYKAEIATDEGVVEVSS